MVVEPHRVTSAALTAARRLGSSRPLYAVSLCTATSQLLCSTASCSECNQSQRTCMTSCSRDSQDSCCNSDGAAHPTSSPKPNAGSHRGAHELGEDADSTFVGQWLTGQLVAQVSAHLEAAAHEVGARRADSEGGSEECYGAVDDVRRYDEALCRAALQWGLLLLLASEHCFMEVQPNGGSLVHSKSRCSQDVHIRQNEGCAASFKPSVDQDDGKRCEGTAVQADTAIREALSAFEMILWIMPPMASRVLPNVIAWLAAGLLHSLGRQERVESPKAKLGQLGPFCPHKCATASSKDPAEFAAENLRFGQLSSLIRSTLSDCQASGPLERPLVHLQRARLLSLLLRGPRVLTCCSRLLAACALPPRKGGREGTRSSLTWVPLTAPQQPTEGQEGADSVFKAEADVQEQLCGETAEVICTAIHDLRSALFSSPCEVANNGDAACTIQNNLRFPYAAERSLLAAFSHPQVRWGTPTATSPQKEGAVPIEHAALLLSFALRIKASPQCKRTFGVLAAPAEDSVVQQATAVLKETDEFYVFASGPTEMSLTARVHCVTRLCSLALTAKHLPKAFQINPSLADSRALLTVNAASAVAELQLAESGENRTTRCPLTGRLHLPEGLPDEEPVRHRPQQFFGSHRERSNDAKGSMFAYLSDEGAFRMAAQVVRILTALVRTISFTNNGRIAGLVIPPLLRVLDIPHYFESGSRKTTLADYMVKAPYFLQALRDGFPVFNELDVCFDAYLEAYMTTTCQLSDGPFDHSFLQCQDYLIDMCSAVMTRNNVTRLAFLKRTRPFIKYAGQCVNVRLYDWLGICLEALENGCIDCAVEGFLSLEQLLLTGTDLQEFLPQILCHVAVVATMGEESNTTAFDHLKVASASSALMKRLVGSVDHNLFATVTTRAVQQFRQLHSEEPETVARVTRWLSNCAAHEETCECTVSETCA
ncbi:hypothetical protein Efla_003453 [Eimeria flavescens]